MEIVLSALIAAAAGFGGAYQLTYKWLMKEDFKGASVIRLLMLVSLGTGFTGLLMQFFMYPLLGLQPDVDKAAKYLIANIILLPSLILIIKFFIGLFSPKQSTNKEHLDLTGMRNEEVLWERVNEELRAGKRVDSIWLRAYSDADGDSSKANARYIKLRVEQLKSEIVISGEFQGKTASMTSESNNEANPLTLFNKSGVYILAFGGAAATLLLFYLLTMPPKQPASVENITANNVKTIPAETKKCNMIYIEQKGEYWLLESDPIEMNGWGMFRAIVPGKEGRAGALVGRLERETDQIKRIEIENELATISANFYHPIHLKNTHHPANIYKAIDWCDLNAK